MGCGSSSPADTVLNGHYFSFKTGGNPYEVVDRFEARQQGNRVTYYRNGPVGSRDRVNSATANAMESYTITGNKLSGPVGATIKPNGDIEYTHGFTSRKEEASGKTSSTKSDLKLGSTPSHGSPPSNNALNTELNNVARNTDDTARARALVEAGADLSSTNGQSWRHTPLHQACYHGRYEMAKALLELGADKSLHSNPCGRGQHGTPLELARGGGHQRIVDLLQGRAGGAAGGGGGAAGGGGKIEFLGLWRDTGDRAMPIKMNVNPGDPQQVRRAMETLLGEMRRGGVSSGILAAQSYNQMHWSADPNEAGYEKHGFIGDKSGAATKSSWSGRTHRSEGLRFDGFSGVIDVLGGDWQNAVYRVTLSGDGKGVEGSAEAARAAAPGEGWFRLVPQHRQTGAAVCWTDRDVDTGKLRVSARDARQHHGGGPREVTRIQLGAADGDASLWRKVDVQGEWFRLENKMAPGSTLNVIHAEHRDARVTLWHDHHPNSLFRLEDATPGAFSRIVPQHAPHCALNVYGAGGHGTDLCLWDDSVSHGRFKLVPVGGGAQAGGAGPSRRGGGGSTVRVGFMIDDWVTHASYGGKPLEPNRGQCGPTSLTFDYEPGAVLCIGGWDNEAGGSAGLFFSAETPLGNFKLTRNAPADVCKVFASGSDSPPRGWQTNDFDDHSWSKTDANRVWGGWDEHLPGGLRSMGLSGGDGVWVGHKKHNFFRINLENGARWANDGSPPTAPPGPLEGGAKPKLVLVDQNDPRRLALANASAVRSGQQAPLALAAPHHGYAICRDFAERREAFGEWEYTALAVGAVAEAVTCALSGGRLVEGATRAVVTPSMLQLHEGNHYDFVWHKHNHPARLHEEAAKHGAPLDLVIHADGSIAPSRATHLRVGVEFEVPLLEAPKPEAKGAPPAVVVVQGQPLGIDGSIAVGEAVPPVQLVQAVGAPSGGSSSAAMPPLIEAADVFKRQLGIDGDNLIEVIDAACDALGVTVSTKGLSAKEKAEECWRLIHG